jgi:hypothetical protein
MPSLAGAVTRLTLACVPGPATWQQVSFTHAVADTFVPVLGMNALTRNVNAADTYVLALGMNAVGGPVPARPEGQFTAMTLIAVPGRVNVFTDKPVAVTDVKGVVDTFRPVLTMVPGLVPVTLRPVSDTYVPALGMSATPLLVQGVADTYVPVLLMPQPNTVKAGTFPKFGDDVYVPVLSMVAAKPRQDAHVADSYVPVLSMTATMSGSAVPNVVDTYVPVLQMDYSLTTMSAEMQFSREDTYVLVLDMPRPQIVESGDVDEITIYSSPYGHIDIVEE